MQLGGVRLSIRHQLQGHLRCGGSGHMFPHVWLQLLESVVRPPSQGFLLGAGHACTLRLALFQMCRPPEGWGVQCGPHRCTNSLGPANRTHQLRWGHPLDTQVLRPHLGVRSFLGGWKQSLTSHLLSRALPFTGT